MRISEHCYAITGLGYSPPWSVNAGFIAGSRLTLIVDTGANTLAAQTIHGYASSAKPGNRLQVINTEKHFDHIGGNGFFRELGIDVFGHVGIQRTAEQFQAEIAQFNDVIADPARRALSEAKVFFHKTSVTNPNRPIDQDTILDLGGCSAEILLTPGHTSTNLSVWIPEDRVLFSGDCLIVGYLPNLDAGTIDDWKLWLESLDRVQALNPAIVVAGHGPPARGEQVKNVIETVRRVLQESIAHGHSPTGA